jgi:hypothetical protein
MPNHPPMKQSMRVGKNKIGKALATLEVDLKNLLRSFRSKWKRPKKIKFGPSYGEEQNRKLAVGVVELQLEEERPEDEARL